MEARYIQRSDSIDITPEKDIQAGEIVIANNLIGVAKLPIKKGELGTLALSGVFDIIKTNRSAFSVGASVFWDKEKRSATTSRGILLGLATKKSNIKDNKVQVVLNSTGVTIEGNATINWQTI